MRILLNGKEFFTDKTSLFQLVPVENRENTVKIINGFQTSKDVNLNEDDEIFLIEKGKMPEENQLEAMMSARHTPKVHENVKNAKVGIAGLGGLGSNIAVALARLGVGHLVLADFDVVEPSNLNRQSYFISHLGMKKTDALADEIRQINPFISVETVCRRITMDNAEEIFHDCEIVCEAFDNPQAKAELINTVLEKMPDVKIVSGSGMAGYFSSNSIKTTRRFSRLYVCGDMENEAKQGCGLMSPRVMICAGHQANMILRLLLDENTP